MAKGELLFPHWNPDFQNYFYDVMNSSYYSGSGLKLSDRTPLRSMDYCTQTESIEQSPTCPELVSMAPQKTEKGNGRNLKSLIAYYYNRK